MRAGLQTDLQTNHAAQDGYQGLQRDMVGFKLENQTILFATEQHSPAEES
jgi:hypothetical protein